MRLSEPKRRSRIAILAADIHTELGKLIESGAKAASLEVDDDGRIIVAAAEVPEVPAPPMYVHTSPEVLREERHAYVTGFYDRRKQRWPRR